MSVWNARCNKDENVTAFFCPALLCYWKAHYFISFLISFLCLKVLTFRPLVLLLRIVLKWRWTGNIVGLVLTGEDGSTRRTPRPHATFSTSFRWTVVGSNPCFRNMKTATDLLIHFNSACHLSSTCSFISYLTVNWGTRWCGWLRHCIKSQKVLGSNPDEVVWI